jgi:hypothetical protein
MFTGGSRSKPNLTPKPGTGFTSSQKLTAEDYWRAFAEDNAAASLKFDEISVELSGVVKSVSNDTARFTVFLETNSDLRRIECQFSSADAAGGIKAGDQVVLVGEGRARMKQNTDPVLVNCRLKK